MDERIGDCADCPIYGTLTQCMCGSWICEECRPWHDRHHDLHVPAALLGEPADKNAAYADLRHRKLNAPKE